MKHTIAFRRNFIVLPKSESDNPPQTLVASVIAELMKFGHMPTEGAMKMMVETSTDTLIEFYQEVEAYLRSISGGNRKYRPFWKNFPEDVLDKDEAELLTAMVYNYHTGDEPVENVLKTLPRAVSPKSHTTYRDGTMEQFKNIFKDIISVNQSLTPQDLEEVKWFVNNIEGLPYPDTIPFKENLCTLAAEGVDVPVKSVTDVLRIAVAMSGGQIHLPKIPPKIVQRRWQMVDNSEKRDAFKFKKFNREERRRILRFLEKTNCDVREGVLKRERWLRLGEILHAGEFRKKFPKAYRFFDKLRNDNVVSWYGVVDSKFEESFKEGVKTLAERPGEFMRRVDALVRNSSSKERKIVLDTLENVGQKVSNKVLFEALTHFNERKDKKERQIMVKGARSRTTLPTLAPLPETVIKDVTSSIKSTLEEKFHAQKPIGTMWIDPKLKNIPLPTNMRSLNPSSKPVIRGTEIPFADADAKVVRAFLHFKNTGGGTNDLSAVIFGDSERFVIDWSRQKPYKDNRVIHSGDSYGRRGYCAEYIDMDVDKLLSKGYKYVLIQINNYVQTPQLVEGNICGFMPLSKTDSEKGKLWKPDTVEHSMVVRVESRLNVAVINLENRSYIPVDEDVPSASWTNNASTVDVNYVKQLLVAPSFSVYDLLKMQNGKAIRSKTKADNVYTFDQFSESYVEILKVMGV